MQQISLNKVKISFVVTLVVIELASVEVLIPNLFSAISLNWSIPPISLPSSVKMMGFNCFLNP